ncbi:hypothetical protein [Sinorhizobium garamanticum]
MATSEKACCEACRYEPTCSAFTLVTTPSNGALTTLWSSSRYALSTFDLA